MRKCHILEQLDVDKFDCLKPGVFVLDKSENYQKNENILFINCPKNDIAIDMRGKKFRIEGVVEEGYNLHSNQVLVSLIDIETS